MSSTTQHPICATCFLHKCSPFSGCPDISTRGVCACKGSPYLNLTASPFSSDDLHASSSPSSSPFPSSSSGDLHAIHASIARIEEKVDGLLRLERALRREKSTQPEGEVNQKTQLREKRLEKDNLLLRTMLADALKLLSDE